MKTTSGNFALGSFGWKRDLPDIRDYTPTSLPVSDILAASKPLKAATASPSLSPKTDLRAWCSPIEDQGNLGSCTAHAGTALLEYYERRAYNKYLDGSRLFLYKVSRNLLGWQGDQGAYLRTTMKAMTMIGIPPEQYLPYDIASFDAEPSSFIYSLAENYKTTLYFRLDPAGTSPDALLQAIKQYLTANLPAMFGFTVYSSFPGIGSGKADIPFPQPGDSVRGGHAVLVVGYDDSHKIGNDSGALLIRNSWGINWGDNGYGWMPYTYVLRGLAVDFWSLAQAKFIDTELFK
jgi:C1A family cysteine protease